MSTEGAIKGYNPNFNGFIELGSFVLHNTSIMLEKVRGLEIEQQCVDIHFLFKYSAARREDYRIYKLQWV